jgi:MerR family transcriptional regulator/heat shock protein HspR
MKNKGEYLMEEPVTQNSMVKKTGHAPAEFEFTINPQEPLFIIGVTSEVVGLPLWTLRKLDEMGVVSPKRIGVRTRCYSQIQIKTLTYVRYLMEERNVNISGVKVILEMELPKEA